MPFPKIDHYAHLVRSRDDLREDIVYKSTGIERVIPYLQEWDVIRIQREGKSYPQMRLEVVGSEFDDVVVRDENGNEYTLVKSWEHGLERRPWLRRDGKSAGAVRRLTILNLNNQ